MKKTLLTLLLSFFLVGSMQAQYNDPGAPQDPAYVTQEMHIQSAGNDIWGMTFTPRNVQGKMPLIIMAHGFNGHPMLYYTLCNLMAKEGYLCYIFDYPGGSTRTRSTGATTDMSLMTEKQNLKDIVSYFRKQKNVDAKQIFLVGESQGGITGALAAADLKGKIKALALMYPAFSIPESCSRFKTVQDIPETLDIMGMHLGRRYYADIMGLDPYKVIGKYTGPVLIVHGDKDQLVPIQYSEKAVPCYKHVEMKVIPGAPHGFYQPEYAKINADYIHDFFNSHRK